ncbi:MAG: hypothetical protein RMY64_23080 [Nostoc sp. DedQUE08]|nr:hypothetical protein [Nostoc sp. DedQUE08]
MAYPTKSKYIGNNLELIVDIYTYYGRRSHLDGNCLLWVWFA